MAVLWRVWHDLWQMVPRTHQHNHVTQLHKSQLLCFLSSRWGFSSSVDKVMTAYSQTDALRQSAQFENRQHNFPRTLSTPAFQHIVVSQSYSDSRAIVLWGTISSGQKWENNKALTPTSRIDRHVGDRTCPPLLIFQAFQLLWGTGTPFKPSVKTDLVTFSRCCLLVLSLCPFYLLSLSLSLHLCFFLSTHVLEKWLLDCRWKCFFWALIPYCSVCGPLCCNYRAVSDIFLINHKRSSCFPSTLNCVIH